MYRVHHGGTSVMYRPGVRGTAELLSTVFWNLQSPTARKQKRLRTCNYTELKNRCIYSLDEMIIRDKALHLLN